MNESIIPAKTEEMITDNTAFETPTEVLDDTAPETDVSTSMEDDRSVQTIESTSEVPAEDSSTPEDIHAELTRLRTELEETKALHARMATELGEFHALFPEVNVSELPESIWEQVKRGIPLAASYALYEKKCNLHREHAAKINMQNAKMTPGAAGKNTPAEYFSPEEVRAMSQSEVRNNYHKILESMKKWNS